MTKVAADSMLDRAVPAKLANQELCRLRMNNGPRSAMRGMRYDVWESTNRASPS